MNNYIENLIKDDFLLLYLGAWDKNILKQCELHPKVKLIENYTSSIEFKRGEIIAFLADKKNSLLRSNEAQNDLAQNLNTSGAKGIILGFRLEVLDQK